MQVHTPYSDCNTIYKINIYELSCYLLECSDTPSIIDRSCPCGRRSTDGIEQAPSSTVQQLQRKKRLLVCAMSRSRCRRRSRHRRRVARPPGPLVVVVAPPSTVADHRRMRCATIRRSGPLSLSQSPLRRDRECRLLATYWQFKNLWRIHVRLELAAATSTRNGDLLSVAVYHTTGGLLDTRKRNDRHHERS